MLSDDSFKVVGVVVVVVCIVSRAVVVVEEWPGVTGVEVVCGSEEVIEMWACEWLRARVFCIRLVEV